MAYYRSGLTSGGSILYKEGEITGAGVQTIDDVGFKPKYLFVYRKDNSATGCIYDETASTTQFRRMVAGSSGQAGCAMLNIGTSATYTAYVITAINNNGFSYKNSSGVTMKYVAVG